MLEGPDGIGVAYQNLLPCHSCADAVRDNPVPGKIPAADDVPGPGCGYRDAPGIQKGALVAVGHQLRTGLAVGIGVIAVQRIGLPVSPCPFPVLVDLICRDIQNRLYTRYFPDTFQEIDCPKDICFIGGNRILIACTDNGLGGQVEDNLRERFIKNLFQSVQIPDVTFYAILICSKPSTVE